MGDAQYVAIDASGQNSGAIAALVADPTFNPGGSLQVVVQLDQVTATSVTSAQRELAVQVTDQGEALLDATDVLGFRYFPQVVGGGAVDAAVVDALSHEVMQIYLGQIQRIDIHLPEGRYNRFYKVSPTTGAVSLFDWDPVTGTGALFADTNQDGLIDLVSLYVRDGGRGDDDGVADGVVADPGFAGYMSLRAQSPAIPADPADRMRQGREALSGAHPLIWIRDWLLDDELQRRLGTPLESMLTLARLRGEPPGEDVPGLRPDRSWTRYGLDDIARTRSLLFTRGGDGVDWTYLGEAWRLDADAAEPEEAATEEPKGAISDVRSEAPDDAVQALASWELTRGGFSVVVARSEGQGLVVLRGQGDVQVRAGEVLQLQVRPDAFAHADAKASVELSLGSAQGEALPEWLNWDGATGQLRAAPPLGQRGSLLLDLVACDGDGVQACCRFELAVQPDAASATNAGRAGLADKFKAARAATALSSLEGWMNG
jgi:uncharacterized cupin superfamily protein